MRVFALLTMAGVTSFSLLSAVSAAAPPVIDLSHHNGASYGATVGERIDHLSAKLVGQKYVADPLGEGDGAPIDHDPLYRFDAFDCTTFVETVIALSRSTSKESFVQELNRIRYRGAKPDFLARNHFPDADWRPHLLSLGVLKDITSVVAGAIPLKNAHAKIDKGRFFASRLPASARAGVGGIVESDVPYLPFENGFFIRKENGYVVSSELLARIPSGAMFNIVRTRFTPSTKVGTELSIWHQGFFIRRKNGELWARHATYLGAGYVTETPAVDFLLAEYLRKVNVRSKDHGLNILMPQ